jgi:hypothetical protein
MMMYDITQEKRRNKKKTKEKKQKENKKKNKKKQKQPYLALALARRCHLALPLFSPSPSCFQPHLLRRHLAPVNKKRKYKIKKNPVKIPCTYSHKSKKKRQDKKRQEKTRKDKNLLFLFLFLQ